MRFLYERYVKCLMINRNSVAQIYRALKDLDLVPPETDDLARLEAELVDGVSNDLARYLTDHKAKLKTAAKAELGSVIDRNQLRPYFKSNDLAILKPILGIREARAAIETLLISTMSHEEIVTLANGRWYLGITKEDLELYQHFFFDTTFLDNESWGYHLVSVPMSESKLKSLAIDKPEDVAAIKHACGFEVLMEYSAQLNKLANDTYYIITREYEKGAPDASKLKVLGQVWTMFGDRHQKWKPAANADTAASRIEQRIKESRAMEQVQAKIHIGPVPDVKKPGTVKPSNVVPMPSQKKAN